MRVLILGGTGEGMAVAEALRRDPRFDPVYSLAGATRTPHPPHVQTRSGGFGGVAGLSGWLRSEAIAALIDATHPYAVRISRNAARAAAETGIALLRVARPAWTAQPGDRWTGVADADGAAAALGDEPRKVLLTVGSKGLAPFRAAGRHCFVVRCIDAPDPALLPARATLLLSRGPFGIAEERALLAEHGIDTLVTKNSGGEATAAKLQAAREAGIEVVMIGRPRGDRVTAEVPDALAALEWLVHLHQTAPRGA